MAAIAFGEVPLKAGKPILDLLKIYKVYILKSCVKERYYIGHTENFVIRLKQHNSKRVKSTKAYAPWKAVYLEEFSTKSEAIKREIQIKKYKSGEAFKKLIRNSVFRRGG